MDATNTVAAAGTPRWNPCLQEARYEFLRLLRSPSFSLPVLLFPPLFYLLFGEVFGANRSPEAARFLLAGYSVFGVMGVALFGFGVTVALDREQGLLLLKRAQPMPPGAYLLAKVAMAMLFAAIVLVLLALLGATVAGVRLAPAQWSGLFATGLLGVLPFSALGLWLGTLVGGRGAPALINLVYLPMAFLSGLFLPLSMLPAALKSIAPLWPAYHLARIAQAQAGFGDGATPWAAVVILLGVTALFLFLARRRPGDLLTRVSRHACHAVSRTVAPLDQARARFGAGAQPAPRVAAMGRVRPPAVDDVGVRDADIHHAGLRRALVAAHRTVLSAVHRTLRRHYGAADASGRRGCRRHDGAVP